MCTEGVWYAAKFGSRDQQNRISSIPLALGEGDVGAAKRTVESKAVTKENTKVCSNGDIPTAVVELWHYFGLVRLQTQKRYWDWLLKT